MRLQHLFTALGTGALLALAGCSNGEVGAAPGSSSSAATSEAPESSAPAAQSVADMAPDLSLVEARSAERWNYVVSADWIQAYDYLTTGAKREVSLGNFLSSKEYHEYRNPSKPRLIGDKGKLAFLECSVLWTPHHPILGTAKNNPGDLTDELHMIETWLWEEGDWYFVKNDRVREFFEAHPDLVKKDKDAAANAGDAPK